MASIATSSPDLAPPRSAPALRGRLEELLGKAGIRVNGPRPWDMRVHAPGVLERIAARGSLALGESYMDGGWNADQLDEFFTRVLRAHLDREARPLSLLLPLLRERILNRQNTRRAWQVGRAHYDLGNDFYQAMLGPVMAYSTGYWKNATTLAQAQEAKLDLICRKLQLRPGMRVLDIGCGWGAFMEHAATHYGVECVGVTVSREQATFARERYAGGLPLEFRLQDYRDLQGRFDRIASIGMFEHVGKKNHRAFMQVAHRCLADDGIFLLHTIGKNERRGALDPWMDKYIFPNAELPAISHISDAADGLFVTEDLHNLGAHYDRTLMEWHANFEAAWPRFAEKLGERFHRQWRYYLLSSAGAFRARDVQVWQWTLTKHGLPGGCPRVD
jgi:cyclopropane-fatty-acyl-phospholipid synthase